MSSQGIPPFEFATAGQILFGAGVVRRVPELAVGLGRRVLVVAGRSPARSAPLIEQLRQAGLETALFSVSTEPDTDTIERGLKQVREADCDLVISIGGGSVVDTAKFLAALAPNADPWMDYLEVIGSGKPLRMPALPLIAVPTTAGTGAEVTRNAVVGSPAHRVKVSLRHPYLLPRYAVVDPDLTLDLPREITAASGLDALTQLLEVFVSNAANPMTDALCREGLPRARQLRSAWADGHDRGARADMCLVSMYSGIALANARLGAVHGLAGPLGGTFPAPHGAICARLLPLVMAANLKALGERYPGHPSVARYDEVARLLTGRADAVAGDGLDWVRELSFALSVPGLSHFGVEPSSFPALIQQSRASSSMKGNPIVLTDDELAAVLTDAL